MFPKGRFVLGLSSQGIFAFQTMLEGILCAGEILLGAYKNN